MTRPRPAPLRPLGGAEVLDGAVRLVRIDARAVLAICLPFALVLTGVGALLRLALLDSKDAVTLAFLLGLVVNSGIGIGLSGLLSPLYTARLLDHPVDARTTLRRVGWRGWALLPLALLVVVGESVGLAALVVGGVWLWGMWAVAAPALVLERRGPFGALRRSFGLVRTQYWRTVGVRLLGLGLTSVLSLVVTIPFEALASVLTDVNPFDRAGGGTSSGLFVLIVSVGTLLSAQLVAPIAAAVDVLLYTDLRMRREGMDIVMGLPPDASVPPSPGPAVSAW